MRSGAEQQPELYQPLHCHPRAGRRRLNSDFGGAPVLP